MQPNGSKIRVCLIDDQAIIRASLRSFLDQEGPFDVVGDSSNAREGISMVEELKPEIVVLDITMPGLSGIDAIPKLKSVSPATKILMLTHHEGTSFVQEAMQAGASGYLSKDSEPEELAMAIQAVHRGDPFLSPKVSQGVLSGLTSGDPEGLRNPTKISSLTPREREVFQLLATGSSNKEVAFELKTSLGTAKKHRENLQRKLQCGSMAELTRLAIREGLLEA